MGSLGKWLLGLIILAIVAALLSVVGPWNAKTRSENMGQSVQAALDAANFGDVTTAMSGNVAKLTGSVGSEARKNEAISIAENAQCDKCSDREAGKRWHNVDGSALTVKKVVPTVVPYTLTGVRSDDGGIILNGYAHSAAEKAKILEAAETAFPGKVTDRTIKIAIGGPDAGWYDVARANIGGLAQLDSGEFSMTDSNSVLTGRTTSTGIRSAINASISGLPAGFNGATNIIVPEAAADNTGEIRSEAICQRLFEQLKGDNKINFAYNSDRITGAPSLALLDTMASAASQCSSFRISVEGHTDSDGSDAYNLDLSQRRAQAVVDVLVAKGVDAANITARGYGETSPVASNATRAGKARNRRIEFKVTRSN